MADEPRGLDTLIEAWRFADNAARLASTGYFYQDIGKLAYQDDTGQYWRLLWPQPPQWFAINDLVSSGGANPETVFADEDGDFVLAG